MLGRGLIAALCAYVLCGCASVSRTAAPPTLALAPCNIAGAPGPVRCGALVVPEDGSKPGGRTISLSVVMVPSSGDRTLPPLYMLDGGPGIAATDAAEFWTTAGSIHRRHRDIVLVDQRGTGHSAPLNCALNFYDPLSPVLDAAEVRLCRERLSVSADLVAYSTAAAVEDLDAVRAAFRHEKIDLIGLSYGTRMAQQYLRAHPDRVRAVALLGTLTPGENLPLSFSLAADAVLRRLAEECARDPECQEAIPDPFADIAALRGRFETGAVLAPFAGRTVEITNGPFWEAVRGQLTTTATQRRLPWLLHEAAQGRFEPLLAETTGQPDHGSNGLLLSVSCPEDTLRIVAEDLAALSGTVFGSYRVRQQLEACKAWGLPPLDAPPRTFVGDDVPVLLMAGDMDAVTPIQWARDVAAHLPRSRVVVIPELGHFPDGLDHMECYDQIIAQFFESGSTTSLDLGCVSEMQPPPFQREAAASQRS